VSFIDTEALNVRCWGATIGRPMTGLGRMRPFGAAQDRIPAGLLSDRNVLNWTPPQRDLTENSRTVSRKSYSPSCGRSDRATEEAIPMPIDSSKVLRLNMPQWQGGDRPFYRIGGRVLAALAPDAQGPEETVLVPSATDAERPLEQGILSRGALLRQVDAASAAIDRHAPEAIVTLGGDCHVDFAPIVYLSEKYGDDLAVLPFEALEGEARLQRMAKPRRS
jgi:hypothetical protein